MRAKLLVLVILLVACGRGGADKGPSGDSTALQAGQAGPGVPPEAAGARADTVLPPMPPVPSRRRGYFTVTGAGAATFEWAWPARAGRCARPPMVLLLGEDVGKSGGSVLLHLPTTGPLTGEYPVKLSDSTGMPEAPAAQVGFQYFDKSGSAAYQASEGAVVIATLDERRLIGSFQITARHIVTEHRIRVAGAFEVMDVEALPPAWCEKAQAAQDSLAGKR